MAPVDEEEIAFRRLYGDWAIVTPPEVAALLAGFDAPWWIAGGWALEAYTGVTRTHDDVDVAFFGSDLPAVRAHFAGTHHLWAAGSGALRPLTDERPELPEWSAQVWVREHALAPWLLDLLVNPGDASGWVFKRDPAVVRPLAEVTWVGRDGMRYLNPEVVLAYKAKLDRPKDRADLDTVLPRLDAAAREWLRATVERLYPDHPWLPLMRLAALAGRGAEGR